MNLQRLSQAINNVIGKEISYSPTLGMLVIKHKSIILRNGITYIGNQISFRSTGLRDTFNTLGEAGITFTAGEVESILAEFARLKSQSKSSKKNCSEYEQSNK